MIRSKAKTPVIDEIVEFIAEDHPCVMAQTVFSENQVVIEDYKNIDSDIATENLYNSLGRYLKDQDNHKLKFESFIAVFSSTYCVDELEFENKLWKLLLNLNTIDDAPWDPNTSSDPESNKFSFSLHSKSFYIVGMHPNSSRLARKAPYTMIVFNLHSQFDVLREVGRYNRVRNLIRRRDKKLQGTINPMLQDFGQGSEAQQYSGRNVSKDWKCPYKFD